MTRLAPALVLAGVVVVGVAGAASATGHHDKPVTSKREVCHPTGKGYVLIRPAQASSHIDEAVYPNGHYWKHEHDGRHDVYATNGACPAVPSPTPVPTTTPTEVPSSTTTTTRPTSTTQTSVPSSSSSTSDVPEMTPTTKPAPPTAKPAKPVPATTQPGRTRPVTSPTRPTVVTSATPPDELAHTGFTATLALLGAGLLAIGVALNRKGARREH